MTLPLMPKATAIWLIAETKLTFDQIAAFCGLHKLEIQAMADGESGGTMTGQDPILSGQLTIEEIRRCEGDISARLELRTRDLPPAQRSKGPRYTPVTKRADKPNAIAWLVKTHPELADAQIARLIGTTNETIGKIRSRTHWNVQNIKPQNPVLAGLCSQADLEAALEIATARKSRAEAKDAKDSKAAVPAKSDDEPPQAANG